MKRSMISPGRARVSSCADSSPRKSSAAWLANTVRPDVVHDGDRLGQVPQHRLQALLDALGLGEQLRVVDRERGSSGELADEQQILLVVGSLSARRNVVSAPKMRPRPASGATIADR